MPAYEKTINIATVDIMTQADLCGMVSIDIESFNPLIYMGGVREYRKVGAKVGEAYQVGKSLMKR